MHYQIKKAMQITTAKQINKVMPNVRDDLNIKSPLKFGIFQKIGGEGFGIMKKAEILPYMTAIWLQNPMMEFLLGTDCRKFALSILVEAVEGEGFRKFQPETEIFRSFSIDVVPKH